MDHSNSGIHLGERIRQSLRCPCCQHEIRIDDDEVKCLNADCTGRFPIVNDVPILVDDNSTLFPIDEIMRLFVYLDEPSQQGLLDRLFRYVPSSIRNVHSEMNYHRLVHLIGEMPGVPTVLVVGGGEMGKGMEPLMKASTIELLETDIKPSPRVALIFDCHSIPFEDKAFDAVILQAVLEHVVDPYRCAEEVHRVLKDQGIVYSEVPGIQPVHEGAYDFTRFTHLGHRRLFRMFDEIASGPTCGPGMSLALVFQFFVMSFVGRRGPSLGRRVVELFARMSCAWLTYFDHLVIDSPAGYDAAASLFFLGRKSDTAVSDKEIIRDYRGMHFGPS